MAGECVPLPQPVSTVNDPDSVEESYKENLAKRLANKFSRGQGGSSLLKGQIGVKLYQTGFYEQFSLKRVAL